VLKGNNLYYFYSGVIFYVITYATNYEDYKLVKSKVTGSQMQTIILTGIYL